ncbi:LysR family transcriptional regulator, partial [Vibrio cholerae]
KTAQGKRLTLTGNFATTNPEALFYAGKAGMGIIVTGHIMIKEELKQGNLVRLLPDVTIDQATVYAYYPKLEYQHTRTQLFLDHLKQKLAVAKAI